MKHKLRFLLAIGIGLMTSIGWLHAENDGYTKDGGNNYTVSTAEGLQNVLKELNKASSEITSTITLDADLDISSLKVMGGNGAKGDFQGMFFLDAPLNKNVTLTLDGGAGQHKIYGSNTIQGTAGSNKGEAIADYATKTYVFYVHNGSKTLTFKNLKIEDTNIVGFNFFGMTNIVFENVVVSNNEQGGIHLNSSNLTATKLSTSGNGKFAVKLSRETANIPSIVLNDGCTFAETTVPQVGFYDRYAYKDKFGEQTPATPTEENFKTMVSGTVGSTMMQTQMAADLHTSNNTYSVRAWTTLESKLTMEYYAEFPSKTSYKNLYFIYANGHPVTISKSNKEGFLKISVDNTNDFMEVSENFKSVIFGGSKSADVESSHITMTGGKVSMIFGGGYWGNVKNVDITVTGGRLEDYFVGGGYGPKETFDGSEKKTADVTGKITANLSGAYIRYLVSGGMGYARTEATDISVTGDNTEILYGLGGGFAPVGISQSLETSYDAIANRTNTASFSMTNGKISECFYIGGGYSYSYTKDITATFNGVAVEGGMKGVGSNGRSNTVTATFTKCNFSKGTNAYTPSIAAVNRGKADVVSMSFNDCTFTSDIKCYLGADVNWQDGSYPVPVSGKANFAFTGAKVPVVQLSEGMQDVTLTGAKANADVFLQKANTEIKTFTILEGKTWNFNNGLAIANGITLTKNGTLAVKGTLTLSKVDQLAMALSSVTSGGTIDLSSVTANDMLGQLNAGTKKALTPGICILCSDATVYTDETSAQLSSATGTVKYIKLESETYSLEIPAALTIVPTIKTKPTASTIEAGQPLSASILTGGEAKATVKDKDTDKETEVVVSGVFSWMDPSTQATVGSNTYKAVFTPTDQAKYEVVKDIDVVIKDVKKYYTVTIGKCDNGKIEVTDANSAGKYEDQKVLTVKAIPNDHYDFSKWGTGITGTADNGSYTVSKEAVANNAVLTATFVAKNYAVTIGDNVKVTKQDGNSVTSDTSLPYGTVLNVVAAPTENVGSLKSLTCNGNEVINNTVTVDGVLNIQATFNDFVPSTYRISLGESVKNGKIQLFDDKGNPIAFGSALTEGTVVSVVAVPDPGYELGTGTPVTVTGAAYENNKFTVAKDAVTVAASFVAKKFNVTTVAEHATITLDKDGEQDYGTSIKITEAKAADDYKLLAVVVNGKEIAKGESFIVKGDTKVNAVVQKLPDVAFADVNQIYTYNKAAQPFVVRTVPAGISGITISYQNNAKEAGEATAAPTEAGTYEVFASLDANSSYASMDKKYIGILTIEKAPYPAAVIPKAEDINTSVAEYEYHWKSDADASKDFRTAYYKLPASLSNYREPEFVIPTAEAISKGNVTPVKLGTGDWVTTRANDDVSLNLSATGGSVSAWLDDALVTSETTLYAGQTLTLKAIPANANYSTRPEWSNNVTVKDGVASITLSDQAATVTATFKGKVPAPLTNKDYTSLYTGTAFGDKGAPKIESSVSGWLVTFKQGDVTFDEPTAVGDYQMIANRPADDVYQATTETVGTLHITKTTAVISDVVGTDITTIQTLNQSVLSGTANVEGTFSWVNPNTQLTAKKYTDIAVLFTPADNNYAPVSGTATVNVTALANEVAVRTIELEESDPANGNGVVLTLNGTVVTAGTTVKAGDKLTATFSAKSGYTATATINTASYENGKDFIIKDEKGNVTITITYKAKSTDPNPGTDPDPDPEVNVTNVSLDKSELTLAVKGTYTLKATVAPADADNKSVTWKSSDDKIATVDKDGKVTAVAIGKATITVTTEDGGKTATCVVTVDAATGLEELIANTRVYGQDHAIRIEPAMSVNVLVVSMNGQLIYNDIVSSATQIPVPAAGIYIVKLGTGNETSVRKVSVK